MEPQLPLVGMGKERQRVAQAFRGLESLLVLGPAGCGKSRLIKECLLAHDEIRYVLWAPSLHGLLQSMARALIIANHTDFLRRAKPAGDSERWLELQPSIHLKGLLWNSLESRPVPMVLDGVSGAGFPTYRFLQRIYHTPGMALFAVARDAPGLGALGRLFWNPTRILSVLPLRDIEARELFEAAADHFQLRDLDLEDFREKVLESAHGNPGQIIEMCRLAGQPQYICGRYIKFSPLRIDTVMKFGR